MIIYQDKYWTLKTVDPQKQMLFSSHSIFYNLEHTWESNQVCGTLCKFNQQGDLLPEEEWTISLPFNPIIQEFSDGHKVLWTFQNGEFLMNEYTE